jgi:hypothetical protein
LDFALSKSVQIFLYRLRAKLWQRNVIAALFSFFVLTLGYSNCTKENLQPLSAAVYQNQNKITVQAQFCTSPPTSGQQNIKYLFILDHSSINQIGVSQGGNTTDADPDGSRRYGPMVNFVNNLIPNPQITTGFDVIDFNDTAKQMAGLNGFDTDSADFVTRAISEWEGPGQNPKNPAPADGGFSDYRAALAEAYTLIQQDLQNQFDLSTLSPNFVATNYIIVFVSGGTPNVQQTTLSDGSLLCPGNVVVPPSGDPQNPSTCPGTSSAGFVEDYQTLIKPLIDQIVALKSDGTYGQFVGNISLNTAFYYNTASPPTAAAAAAATGLLQQMAQEGNGQFQNFAGAQVLYQNFAPAQTAIMNQVVDVFLENKNAVWWNGQYLQDTDGDGLPDQVELQIGSNPNLADSDGNGVSDLVEYKTTGQPCAAAGCAAASRNPYGICAGFKPTTDAAGNVKYNSSSNDGLNDCEKYLLGANYRQFNSSGSMIPDFLAFKNGISVQSGNPYVANAIPFSDGYSNYTKLKLGMPLDISAQNMPDFIFRATTMTVSSTPSPFVTCYDYNVQNVLATSSTNVFRVTVVQNSALFQDNASSTVAEGSVDSQNNITLKPSDFH